MSRIPFFSGLVAGNLARTFTKYEFQEDAGRRSNEQAPFAKLRQFHSRIRDGKALELALHPVIVGEAKRDVINRLAIMPERRATARNEMHHRVVTGVKPVAREGKGGSIARLHPQNRFKEGARAFQIVRAQCCVIEFH